jgi:predicted O-linked N-acetylglucosamine transferase (SPINDLY family)
VGLSGILGVTERLAAGLEHHQSGRLDQAEEVYRELLRMNPRNADAYHLLGMVAFQRGDCQVAAGHIREALRIARWVPQFHNNLGLVLEGLGQRQEALASFQEAVRLAPAYAEAQANLGKALQGLGRYQEAIVALREALRLKPGFLWAWHWLGCAAQAAGDLPEAIRAFQQVLERQPDHPEASVNLSSALKQQGRFEEAEACCRRVLASRPDLAEAQANLGAVLLNLKKYEEAEAACREALRLKPNLPEPYSNLGAVLLKTERIEEARRCCEEALRLKPDSPEALNNLGGVLRAQNHLEQARGCFERALAAAPDYFEAWLNLGAVLKELGLMEEATTACRETLRRHPDSAEAHSNLGSVLEEQGRLEEAQASLREAIRLQPDLAEPYMNLGATLKNQGRLEEALSFCRKAMELDPASDSPFSNFFYYLHYDNLCEPEAVFEEHRRWGERRRALAASAAEHTNDRSPERRLRIGYVSPDFRRHSVAFFVEPVLAAHHRDSVEVCCYSNVAQPDDVTERFRAMADHWRDIRGLPEAQVVELIRGDGIDILVDLAGHTRGSRLMVFARKPAPIQVTWCGYPATTGLASIDYRLTDALADPAGQTDHLYTEELVRLPVPFTCYRPPSDAPEVSGLPALAHGAITFGSFNFLAKVTPRIIAAWSALLEKAPGARLVLKSAPLVDESTRRLVWERFRERGIDPARVELLGPVDHREHLLAYRRIDIALDTFPYHGTTTTCEALWMGVPVVVLAGSTHASRVGVSLLASVGLEDWVAQSFEDYVGLAASRARDPERLAALRAGLRQRVASSPLTDATAFASHLEEAYRRMWRRWCGGSRA